MSTKEMKETPFLEIDPRTASPTEIIAELQLSGISEERKISFLQDAFILAAKANNDKSASELLDLLKEAWKRHVLVKVSNIEGENCWERKNVVEKTFEESFIRELKALYWTIPDRTLATSTKSKLLTMIIRGWKGEKTDWDLEIFRFAATVLSPLPENFDFSRNDKASEDEKRSAGRFISDAERETILGLIRSATSGSYSFKPEMAAHWMKVSASELSIHYSSLPKELLKILAIARTRNGFPETTMEDIANAEFLGGRFNLKAQSETAVCLAQRELINIRQLDDAIEELVLEMQPEGKGLWGAENIGESEYVLGEIEVIFKDKHHIYLNVELPSKCHRDLGKDVCGRARRHIQKWISYKQEYLPHLGDIEISLKVSGGQDNIKEEGSWVSNMT